MGKILNANFLTGPLCGVEDKRKSLFHNGIYRKKNKKKTNKKISEHGTAGIYESGSWLQLLFA